MKRLRTLLALGLLAAALITGPGCGEDPPLAPTKTPEQIAAEAAEAERKEALKRACTQTSLDVLHLQGGFTVYRVSSKDDVIVRGDPKNAAGAILDLKCDPPFARDASWTHLADGVRVRPFGAIRSLQFALNVEGDGLVVTLGTHVSQGGVFKGESAILVSSVGVSARSEFDREIGAMLTARRLWVAAPTEDRDRVARAIDRLGQELGIRFFD